MLLTDERCICGGRYVSEEDKWGEHSRCLMCGRWDKPEPLPYVSGHDLRVRPPAAKPETTARPSAQAVRRERDRQIARMREAGFTAEEIAGMLGGISKRTVYRARQRRLF